MTDAATPGVPLGDAGLAAPLAVPRSAPLLQIRRVAPTHNDPPVEDRMAHVNTAHHECRAEIGRAG